jgi:purine nucleosidase
VSESSPAANAPLPVLLDTDIGSDVDDALALAMILGSPEIDLVGATTAYGDTLLRARIAKRLAQLAGRNLTVIPGERETLARREVWVAGHEGALYGDLSSQIVDTDTSALQYLLDAVGNAPQPLHLLAIAPLTNIARAIEHEPGLTQRIAGLAIMGGDLLPGRPPEHNFSADPEAAAIVFGSGCPITLIGLNVTRTVELTRKHLQMLQAARPLGALLAAETEQWLAYWGDHVDHPHDAVAALTLIAPHLFAFSDPTTISVSVNGAQAGRVQTTAKPRGHVRVAQQVDPAAAVREITNRILAAARAGEGASAPT